MKTILITGSSGFCGSYLVDYFQEKPNQYVVFSTSRRPKNRPNHILHDLHLPLNLKLFPKQVDTIIHCAANVNEKTCDYNIIENNMRMSFNTMKYALKVKPKNFINLSSVSVYGKPKNFRINEKTQTFPSTNYGLSKLVIEYLTEKLLSKKMNVVNLRLGYVIGLNLPSRYIISKFEKLIKKSKPITLVNPDITKLPFIDNSDIAHICKKIVNEKHIGVYNLTSDRSPTLRETFEEIKKYYPNSKSRITEKNLKGDEFPYTYSNNKIKKEFGINFTQFQNSFGKIFKNEVRNDF